MNASGSQPSRRRAIIALVLVNAMWGSSFPLVKSLNLQIDQAFDVAAVDASSWLRSAAAAWLIGIRFAAALLLFAFLFGRTLRQVRWPHVVAGATIGALFFLGLLLQVMGLGTIPASRSGFLTSLAVVFTPLLGTLVKRRLPAREVVAAAVIALAGVSVLTGLVTWEDGSLGIASDALQRWTTGDTLTTVAALFFSAQILVLDQAGKRHESLAFTPVMFATTVILAALAFGVLQSRIPEAAATPWRDVLGQPSFYVLMGLLIVFPSLLAFVWMNRYQPRLSAGEAAVVYTMEPLFAFSWALFLPYWLSAWTSVAYGNEQFNWPLVLGGVLVLLANVLALWEPSEPQPADEPQPT
ncbi:DMT family transporter [Roseimaritima sediminicola]|uniref:DMT family transporter n=1 Tax=Roseimaritima sediminicola TaxID=2662066 RepID=UPI0012982A73|nr:DMT family transporter [Roseimaritima sediminicola]